MTDRTEGHFLAILEKKRSDPNAMPYFVNASDQPIAGVSHITGGYTYTSTDDGLLQATGERCDLGSVAAGTSVLIGAENAGSFDFCLVPRSDNAGEAVCPSFQSHLNGTLVVEPVGTVGSASCVFQALWAHRLGRPQGVSFHQAGRVRWDRVGTDRRDQTDFAVWWELELSFEDGRVVRETFSVPKWFPMRLGSARWERVPVINVEGWNVPAQRGRG